MKKYLLIAICFSACSWLTAQSTAWDRVNSMGKGMNFSWMENWWGGSPALNYSNYLDLDRIPSLQGELDVMKEIGVETVRLPVVFDVWGGDEAPFDFVKVEYFEAIDSMVAWTKEREMKLIIDYHHGSLTEANHSSEALRIDTVEGPAGPIEVASWRNLRPCRRAVP